MPRYPRKVDNSSGLKVVGKTLPRIKAVGKVYPKVKLTGAVSPNLNLGLHVKVKLMNLMAQYPALELSKWGIPRETPYATLTGVICTLTNLLFDYNGMAEALGAERGKYELRNDGDIVNLSIAPECVCIPRRKVLEEMCEASGIKKSLAEKLVRWLVLVVTLEPSFIPFFYCFDATPSGIRLRFDLFNLPI